MGKKNILFISHSISRNGAVNVLLELIKHWVRNEDIKCEILFRDSKGEGKLNEFEEIGKIHHSVKSVKYKSLRRFDLIFNNTMTNGWVLKEISPSYVPVITYIHELDFAICSMKPSVVLNTLQHTDHYVACSVGVKSNFQNLFKIRGNSISVVNGFISSHGTNKIKIPSSKDLKNSGAGEYKIGILANMDYRKGIDRFLCLIPVLEDVIASKKIRWIWCGKGAEFYKKYVPTSSLERISFIDSKKNPWEHLEGISLLFSFSREDPFPLTNLEALVRQIPVAGIEGSGGIDELESLGYAKICSLNVGAINSLLRDCIENTANLSKPFLWSTQQLAPKVIKIANTFLEKSFLNKLFFRKPRFDFSPLALDSPSIQKTVNSSCSYEQFIMNEKAKFELKAENSSEISDLKFSIVVPLHSPKMEFLERAVNSVKAQVFGNWELILVDDASNDLELCGYLDDLKQADSRIRSFQLNEHKHISNCMNQGVELSNGSWVGFLDQDDELAEHALFSVVQFLKDNPDTKILYTDEDKIDENGNRVDPYFKPDWNPRLLLSQNYFCHFLAIEKKLFEDLGGFREGFEGAQDWDLCLRASLEMENSMIGHISQVLYHWRIHEGSTSLSINEKGEWVKRAQEKTILSHLERTRMNGIARVTSGNHWEVLPSLCYKLPRTAIVYYGEKPSPSNRVIIESLMERSNYSQCDFLFPEEWSFASSSSVYKKNNLKSLISRYECTIFLKAGIEPLHSDWIKRFVYNCSDQNTGFVGPKLLHPATSRIISAGMVLQKEKILSLYNGLPFDFPGDKDRAMLAQNIIFLHPSVLSVQTCKLLPYFNSVDLSDMNLLGLCEKLHEGGLRNLLLPSVCCYLHHRDRIFFEKCEGYSHKRCSAIIEEDSSFNTNLYLQDGLPCPIA